MSIKNNSVAIVTGAGRGIGKAIALDLAARGAKVVICDMNEQSVQEVIGEIAEAGGEAMAAICDVTVKDDVVRMVNAAKEKWGRVDICVTCAIVLRDKSMKNMTEEDWDLVTRIGLRGTFLVLQAVLEAMKENKFGRVVNLTSPAWMGNFGQANYSATKGGVNSLTFTAAKEYAKHGITVNAVGPGLIDTPLTRSIPTEVFEKLAQSVPAGYYGEVEDVANLVAFLCDEDSRYITGQIIHIDGGATIGRC